MTLTGAQLLQLLEQQWAGSYPRVLQVSSGVNYTWDEARSVGERVVRESVMVQGKRLEPDANYRVTVNSFMASGGDDVKVLLDGRDRLEGIQSRDAIIPVPSRCARPLSPGNERRITRLTQGR